MRATLFESVNVSPRQMFKPYSLSRYSAKEWQGLLPLVGVERMFEKMRPGSETPPEWMPGQTQRCHRANPGGEVQDAEEAMHGEEMYSEIW